MILPDNVEIWFNGVNLNAPERFMLRRDDIAEPRWPITEDEIERLLAEIAALPEAH